MNKSLSNPSDDRRLVDYDLPTRRSSGGSSIAGLLEMPENLRQMARWVMREIEVSVEDAAQQFDLDLTEARNQLDELVECGFLRSCGICPEESRYQLASIQRRPRRGATDLLGKLDT